ncbi:TetR/AcrR family transcriptional regulator [Lacticaseibacillus porcinae]|uniref:TetR/AcrR family transcriptional regulator n=1 Tax=Lacticaseibacillus porcinae TaxID=1123687 RepID=UPI0013DE401E|nr:TetR/AcrR family transcriptional regulator [Lacticaseibacillus porcinae]
MVKHRVLDQQKVLAIAGVMASETGVANLNFKALASRLDIRSQSLYNYYPNIEALIEALGADFLGQLDTKLTHGLVGLSGVDALKRFAEISHDYFDSTGNRVQLIYYVHRYAEVSPFVQAMQAVIDLLKRLVAGVHLYHMSQEAYVQGFIASVLGFTVLEIMNYLPGIDRDINYHQMLQLYLDEVQ